jgi:hypothetical protein
MRILLERERSPTQIDEALVEKAELLDITRWWIGQRYLCMRNTWIIWENASNQLTERYQMLIIGPLRSRRPNETADWIRIMI